MFYPPDSTIAAAATTAVGTTQFVCWSSKLHFVISAINLHSTESSKIHLKCGNEADGGSIYFKDKLDIAGASGTWPRTFEICLSPCRRVPKEAASLSYHVHNNVTPMAIRSHNSKL